MNRFSRTLLCVGLLACMAAVPVVSMAQDSLPHDNGITTYHTAPRYRESESHPLRIIGYMLHPIGWVAREVVFRPISYFASSTETTRSVMGYREPFDYRQPECFSADDSVPDCRTITPFNYEMSQIAPLEEEAMGDTAAMNTGERFVYMPDVNFDFDKRSLNDLGQGKSRQVAQLLREKSGVKVVLQGHADYMGSDQYNEKLGMDRAEAVRQELITLGIPADQLSTVTFGESQPVFAEQTDWARAVNRRVAVQFQE